MFKLGNLAKNLANVGLLLRRKYVLPKALCSVPMGEDAGVRGLRRETKRQCAVNPIPSKVDRDLLEFVTEEIIRERKAQVHKDPRTIIDDFQLVIDGTDVQLIKEIDKEKITISFNINHTVVTEFEEDMVYDKPDDLCLIRSKPNFEVNMLRGDCNLSFVCSFMPGPLEEKENVEIFRIDEVSIYQNVWNDRIYSIEGQLIDSYLYELLMKMLNERGITNNFVMKISELATAHEHTSYIGFLEKLSKFTFSSIE